MSDGHGSESIKMQRLANSMINATTTDTMDTKINSFFVPFVSVVVI